jgi:hypothetical protein
MIKTNRFNWLLLLFLSTTITSCEFKCKVGGSGTGEPGEDTKATLKNGAALYNGIELNAGKVAVTKAWLAYSDNYERVAEGNFVDFKRPVRIIIQVGDGWTEENDKVFLGASQKVTAENGALLLDEPDLFAQKYAGGISVADSRTLGLSVTIQVAADKPTFFTVSFKIWDKKGDGFIEGSFKLYSK